MVWEDPYSVLGVERNADKATVKRAWRDLALKYHPDKNSSSQAVEQYHRIRQAAEALLKQATPLDSGQSVHAHWRRQASSSQWAAISRSARLPIIFCGSCIIGGFILFAGAVYVHQDLYTYNMHRQAEERRQHPNEVQQRIMMLLQEKQAQQRMEAAASKPHTPQDGSASE
ncbi:hypothetical protein WJX72_005513 [[Myrmecia] bisecta]|uniref:J domain-containing protein n=1 Tax=[Myrmecia] bisecta TaxID=41462 RepID=A0AAW1QAR9_9CHLO